MFGAIFVALTLSSFYFATRPVPWARRMDAARSALLADGEEAVLARVLVLGVPRDGEVRALAVAPQRAGERWRIDVRWTAEPSARVDTQGGERLFEVRIPAAVREVEVWDLRGGLTPERMLLALAPSGGS